METFRRFEKKYLLDENQSGQIGDYSINYSYEKGLTFIRCPEQND